MFLSVWISKGNRQEPHDTSVKGLEGNYIRENRVRGISDFEISLNRKIKPHGAI